MLRVAVAIVLSSLASAQTKREPDIIHASKSPFLLARYVESHKVFDWNAVFGALGTRDPELVLPPCGANAHDPCSTQIVTVFNPDQAILILQSGNTPSNDVYLRYLEDANGAWRFAGERRAFIQHYSRRHEVMRFGNKPFLKISSDRSQPGGGFMQEVEDWFDLTQPDFEPVFSVTVGGNERRPPVGVGRSLSALCVIGQASARETIDVILHVQFVGTGLDLAAAYVGVYDRAPSEKKFVLRRAFSGLGRDAPISTKDFAGLADIFHLSNEQLLVFALPGLQKIASGSDKDAREWLDSILSHAKDTPEKETLLESLAKH
jgi:hypothetical protein